MANLFYTGSQKLKLSTTIGCLQKQNTLLKTRSKLRESFIIFYTAGQLEKFLSDQAYLPW